MALPRSALLPAALSFFLITVNASMVTTALPAIGRQLGDGGGLAWVLTGYSLVFALCLLPAGAWSDRTGAARAFTVGVVVFAALSAVCAVADDLALLLGARAIQGAAAAVVLPAGLSMLNASQPDPARRAKAIGRWAAAGAVALVIGSPLGGGITTALGWTAVFWLNLPVALVVLAAAHRLPGVPAPRRRGARLSSLVVSSSVISSTATGFTLNFASYGAIFVVTLRLQNGLGQSAWLTGLAFVPMTLLIVPANLLASRLGTRRSLLAGPVLMAVGLVGLAFAGSSVEQMIVWLMPVGVGGGLIAPGTTTLMLDGVPSERSGLGTGLLNAARQFGSGAAPAILGPLLSAAGFGLAVAVTAGVIAVPAVLHLTAAQRESSELAER